MKKLKLAVEDLVVSSFAAEKETGAVYANESMGIQTRCGCTHQEGCYPSKYCSWFEGCMITHQENCWTDEYNYCPIGTGQEC
jgi:hypothetical protein